MSAGELGRRGISFPLAFWVFPWRAGGRGGGSKCATKGGRDRGSGGGGGAPRILEIFSRFGRPKSARSGKTAPRRTGAGRSKFAGSFGGRARPRSATGPQPVAEGRGGVRRTRAPPAAGPLGAGVARQPDRPEQE